ncbi:pilus assembly protein CpaF [Yersinia pseudotuberculosis]|uniref:Type II secretion system protein E n=9 Tax=Yersinia pseudotuberculosis complex TaxID=1649845 RepID=A0A0H3B000_YERPY|nr:CpaF family protein [Yersinia pseudotuberculosis]AJJ60122.1 ATP synthase alpha/beta family, nucleotide-binding domain protein [Yersinia pseudotuberculosis YPIII]AYW86776.1 CpaF family protein [Yersinia pseudotuberculosis]AYX01413.1 CpaF family protein [Yersinia pseudotuberculosis]AZA29169.1 CpaF family protein [Yersinia pseudotuberculosis]MBK1426166.1 CpaF family protein [Yersinia pseudotuberculosis]
MIVPLKIQELMRERMLANIDINKVELLVGDRNKLIGLLSQTFDDLFNNNEYNLTTQAQKYIIEMIADEITGFGPLRELMEDDSISDIMVNGPERIFIERYGLLKLTDRRFVNNTQLTDIAKRLMQKVNRRIDEGRPLADARLIDGSRINVAISPIALDGTALSIRKFSKNKRRLEDLVDMGAMSSDMANFLIIAASCRVNIIISGGTGSGKTTLLNALSKYISEDERVITLEDAAELNLEQPHVVRMETRLAGLENTGQITMRDLVINSLRMRPDRIIIGECRGEETFEMLQAMNTGHNGSMSTLHANTPRDAVARLESMIMMGPVNMPLITIRRNIASAINLIVQVSRMNDGSRKIRNISEIMGMEGEHVVLQDIFTFQPASTRDDKGRIQGEFINHGLFNRSSVRINADIHNLANELNSVFSTVSK